jgi:hypothetical protein
MSQLVYFKFCCLCVCVCVCVCVFSSPLVGIDSKPYMQISTKKYHVRAGVHCEQAIELIWLKLSQEALKVNNYNTRRSNSHF